MGGLSRAQAALVALGGVCVLVIGFLAGSAIGGGKDASPSDGQSPTRIATRSSAVDVPTLGNEVKRIPTLEAQEQVAQTTTEEGAATTPAAPSSSAEEAAPEEESASPPPASTREPAPEVTVAPNG